MPIRRSFFSYFEAEGDQSVKIKAQPEDELFNLIRLNPDLIRTGERELIPSLIYQRFSHNPLQAEDAVISKKKIWLSSGRGRGHLS